MCLIGQAFYQLCFCIFCREIGNFFETADMFFLVFLQFCSFDIDQVYLTVQVFLDGFVFFYLLIQTDFFLVDSLFFLAGPVFTVVDFLVFLQQLSVMRRFQLHKFFFGFQFFFFPDGFSP